MSKLTSKAKFRVTFLTLVFIVTLIVLASTLFSYTTQIMNNKKESALLNNNYLNELEEEENFKSEINKLQNPEYMARYTREKYLYSAKDEIIIKIEE